MVRTIGLLLLLLQPIFLTAFGEKFESDFDKPDHFRLPFFSPHVPIKSDPIIFEPVIFDPVVNPLDPNTPPAPEIDIGKPDQFKLPFSKPRAPIKPAPIKRAPVKPSVNIKPNHVMLDPINPLDPNTPPTPV